MSSSAALDADASRPRSGILTPSSDGSENRRAASIGSDGGPRSRAAAAAMSHLLDSAILVKPHPPNLHVQPRHLLPLMSLPRQALPLASLDTSSRDSAFSQTRFVECHVKILDLESRLGPIANVVIARSESHGTAYALERQRNGLYVMLRLGSWVDLGELAREATAVSRHRITLRQPERSELQTSAPVLSIHQPKELKKKRAAIEAIQSLVRKKTKPQSKPGIQQGNSQSDGASLVSAPSLPLADSEGKNDGLPAKVVKPALEAVAEINNEENKQPASSSQQTSQSLFEHVRSQYFEILYRSMGSLAYFAKGPLSRARSAFHLDLESDLEMEDLINFLQSLVLTTVQIDKKYRETIPDIIGKMKTLVDASDASGQKKRKPKKMKPGRDSLYPQEDESVRNWWNRNKPESTGDELSISSSQLKACVSTLRTRETQLQMILILEILALKTLVTADDTGGSNLPALPGYGPQSRESNMPPVPKKRNKHNLPVLVDVHADRLTIWQSTAPDEHVLRGDSQASQLFRDDQVQQKSSSEPLRDFCVDIVVPFFSARLPELCDAISRKLGGPVIATPPKPKPKLFRQSSSKNEQKPGTAAARRSAQPNAKRTLQRALSTEQSRRRSVSRGPGNAIALMRSATSTSLMSAKREGSETFPSKDLSRNESLVGRRKTLLSRSHSTSKLEETKASRKALVEAELKDAISALRKPNREIVGRAMEEAEECRATTTATGLSAKKATRPISRSNPAHSVQVKATPANNRFRDVFAVKREAVVDVPSERLERSTEELVPPSSEGLVVPSTGRRHGQRDALADSAPLAVARMDETPSGLSRQSWRTTQDEPAAPPLSPLFKKGTAATMGDGDAIIRRIRSAAAELEPDRSLGQNVVVTPIKKCVSRLDLLHHDDPTPAEESGGAGEISIYEALGWDHDYDDI